MERAKFPMPYDLETVVSLLNASRMWNLTLVPREQGIYVFDGDQPVFIASTQVEAESFLAGCFLATFMGNSLETIHQEIVGKRFSLDREWDDIANDIERQRKDRASESRTE